MLDLDDHWIGKRSHWQAHVSVAATGTMTQSYQRDDPIGMHPKALARLEHTSADIRYWDGWWREGRWAMRPRHEHHAARYDVDHAVVIAAFADAEEWMRAASDDPEFDGGSLTFCYSGHGQEETGTLCLADRTTLSPDDFVEACLRISRASPSPGRLRVSAILDSCYSGAFLLSVLDAILRNHNHELTPDYLSASSMHDEVSWELPVLNHGLATYCQSVRPTALGSMVASASGGQTTWSIAAGPAGCSYVTGGAQNPATYDSYELRGAAQRVALWDGDPYDAQLLSRDLWRIDLLSARNALRTRLDGISDLHVRGQLTEEDVRQGEHARRLTYDETYRAQHRDNMPGS